MNKNWKKLLCAVAAVLLLSACRIGGGETTLPSEPLPQQTTAPTETVPGVEEWPEETTLPQVPETVPQTQATEPSEEPTAPAETEPGQKPTEPAETTQPTAPPETTQPQTGNSGLSYEEYLAMDPARQQAFYESFPSLEAFIAWHNAALEEYEKNQPSIEVTGGIDIGDYINP